MYRFRETSKQVEEIGLKSKFRIYRSYVRDVKSEVTGQRKRNQKTLIERSFSVLQYLIPAVILGVKLWSRYGWKLGYFGL
jgi:hypothetical protein